jgi:ABC-type antimicrobial peptide transport system permease subunit
VYVEGFQRGPDTDANARFTEVSPGFFRALDVPLHAGREFTADDEVGTPKVAIVNEAFVRKFNLGRQPVGKRMGVDGKDKLDVEIVGVVPDTKYSEVKQKAPALFFAPVRQDTSVGAVTYYVRTSLRPEQLLRTIPGVVKAIDPNLPVENLKTMPQQVRDNTFLDRMISTLSAAFATLATLLAAVGLYGVLAYTVAQRTREIGVRIALGADTRRVHRLVLGQMGRMLVVGALLGGIAAVGLGRAAASLLWGLKGHDPLVLGASATVLAVVATGRARPPTADT